MVIEGPGIKVTFDSLTLSNCTFKWVFLYGSDLVWPVLFQSSIKLLNIYSTDVSPFYFEYVGAQMIFNCSILVLNSYSADGFLTLSIQTTLKYGIYNGFIFNGPIAIKDSSCLVDCIYIRRTTTQYDYGAYFDKDINFVNVTFGECNFFYKNL